MAAFLKYFCAARLSNNVGFWRSSDETFQMVAFSSQGLLLETALWPSAEDGSVHPLLFAAHIIWGMQKAFSNVCGMNLNLEINLKNANSVVSVNVKHFNPDHLFSISLFMCGFSSTLLTLFKWSVCSDKLYCKSALVIKLNLNIKS